MIGFNLPVLALPGISVIVSQGQSGLIFSFTTLIIVLISLVIIWMATIIFFMVRGNFQKKKYIGVLENLLKEKAETTLALKESEQRYHQLIYGMNEGLILTDESNIIRFANPRACKMLKIQANDLLNQALKRFILGEPEILKNSLKERTSLSLSHYEEVQMVQGDGEVIWVSLSINYPDPDPEKGGGAVIVLSDITSKKLAETERNELTADLNQKIKQLNCLFDISDIVGVPGITFDGIFERSLEIIPNGLKYSHDVCTEISFGDKRYASPNYLETPWSFTVPIRVQKKKLGHIKVGYLEEKPRIKKDPFHINEKILLKNIAEKLGQIIETRNIQQTLQVSVYGKSVINK